MAWEDHVPKDERGGLLAQYDDGSAVFLSSYSGGADLAGLWGRIKLMRVASDGETTFRDYRANGEWEPSGVSPAA